MRFPFSWSTRGVYPRNFSTPVGTDGAGHIVISVETNVVTGVAPLLVYFDAKGTTSDATSRPFIDCAFCWQFGDAGSGNFPTTGNSRNASRGPEAAHLFETPGVYEVVLAVRDPLGRVLVHPPITITVDDPDAVFAGTDTICFSTAGDFAGAPAGSTQVTTNLVSVIKTHVATGKRLLLRRGETFSGDTGFNINVLGPGIVGAFGAGADPIITTSIPLFLVSGDPALVTDWTIRDIQVDGLTNVGSRISNIQGTAINCLFLRVTGIPSTLGRGFSAPISIIDLQGQDLSDGLFFVECDVRSIIGGSGDNIIIAAARRLVVMGCEFHDTTQAEHNIRIMHCDRGVLMNNNQTEAPSPRVLIKCHAGNYQDPASATFEEYTQYICCSDNYFSAVGDLDIMVGFGPQNDNNDERVRWIIFERNYMEDAVGSANPLEFMSCDDFVVRENIIHGSSFGPVVNVGRKVPNPLEQQPSRRGMFANNTVYRTTGTANFITFSSLWEDISARNNALIRVTMPADNAEFVSSNTVTTTTPGFVTEPPLVAADYHLLSTSVLRGAGDAQYGTAWDYFITRMGFGVLAPPNDAGAAQFDGAQNGCFSD